MARIAVVATSWKVRGSGANISVLHQYGTLNERHYVILIPSFPDPQRNPHMKSSEKPECRLGTLRSYTLLSLV